MIKINTCETGTQTSDDIESSDSLECFMKDMDEKYQLLINCKADESSNEEIIYNFNNNGSPFLNSNASTLERCEYVNRFSL
jgi:hypothetical protein